MDSSKYDRQIVLRCNVCASTDFKTEGDAVGEVELLQCASCGRKTTKAELTSENQENIEAHVDEVGRQVVDDLTKQFTDSLKKTFGNNKNFRIK